MSARIIGKFLIPAAAVAAIGAASVVALRPADAGSHGEEAMSDHFEVYSVEQGALVPTERVEKSDDEWRAELTDEQFRIMRKQGTERAFTGALWDNKREGVYRCAACGNDLFLSTTKFETGTGWPSFYEPVHPANVGTEEDRTLWMVRTEVHCSRCGAHLGHVFVDGP